MKLVYGGLVNHTFCSAEPSSVVVVPADVTVYEEAVGVVVLQCTVTGGGTSETLTWSRCGQIALPHNVEIRGNSLVFSPALRSHTGCYNCTSLNAISSSSALATVTVLCKFLPAPPVTSPGLTTAQSQACQ